MNWIDKRSSQQSLEILGQVALKCSTLGGPQSRALYELVVAKDYQSLLSIDIDYATGETRDIIMARQILGLYSKNPHLPLDIDRALVAADRFVVAETMCLATNRRLRSYRRDPSLLGSRLHSVFHGAAGTVASILGPVPLLDDLNCQFGPGANTNVKGAYACPRAKLSASLMCSYNLGPRVGEYLYEVPAWTQLHAISESEDSYICDVTLGHGKVTFVPKNAKTDRSIVVEPLLNSFFQKGVGSHIRGRLQRFGVDLTDQTRNQRLACKGSIDDSLATIDLSMASDCLSQELVRELLPIPWVQLLEDLRTGTVEIPDAVMNILQNPESNHGLPYNKGSGYLTLEKFSSMGNGFTFELESLIFYALTLSVCRVLGLHTNEVSIYGDDIICPSAAYPLLEEVLQVVGFSLNSEKSFVSGPFRESCGADYVSGIDVRPFYAKDRVNESLLYQMHNFFRRNGEFELADYVAQLCKPHMALYGPDGFGDGHLIGSHSLRHSRAVKRAGWGGGYFDTYMLCPVEFNKPLAGDAVLPVYSVYTRSGEHGPTNPYSVRGTIGYAKVSIYTLGISIF